MTTIIFLGRSVDGIIADAQSHFGTPVEDILVVSRDGDNLPVPEGLSVVEVSSFEPQPDAEYTVIANGGTSAQLVPVLLRLFQAGVPMRIYDMQRDKATELK